MILMQFCADIFICDSMKNCTFHEGNSIGNKSIIILVYKMIISTKYHLFCKNMMKTVTNNNLH